MSVIGTCFENETKAETGYFDRLFILVTNDWRCNRFYKKIILAPSVKTIWQPI